MNLHLPLSLGITGGIGCGKTTVGKILQQLGWNVIDTDAIGRELLRSDEEIISMILSLWPVVRSCDGTINRKALADIVFTNRDALETLNQITHPKIRKLWKQQRDILRKAGSPTAVIIPLLHEVRAAKEFDAVVCVGCTSTTQIHRLQQRGWSLQEIHLRLRAQFSVQQKAENSDYLLWNDGDLRCLHKQISTLLSCTESRFFSARALTNLHHS